MNKKVKRNTVLLFLFILFFTILNIVIFPSIKEISSIENPVIIIFLFWFIMIGALYAISHKYKNY